MAKNQTSLKSKNAPYLWLFIGANFAVFLSVTIGAQLNGECAITILPFKFLVTDGFVDPSRGSPFQIAHHIGQTMCRSKSDNKWT